MTGNSRMWTQMDERSRNIFCSCVIESYTGRTPPSPVDWQDGRHDQVIAMSVVDLATYDGVQTFQRHLNRIQSGRVQDGMLKSLRYRCGDYVWALNDSIAQIGRSHYRV